MLDAMTPTQAILNLLNCSGTVLDILEESKDRLTISFVDDVQLRRITLHVVEHDLPLSESAVPAERVLPPTDLSADDAIARGLPLYMSREWLVEQLVTHGTPANVAAATGMQADDLEWARTTMHITSPRTEQIQYLWDSGRFQHQGDLAAHLGVSVATVSKAVGSARDQETIALIREIAAGGLSSGEIVTELRRRGDRRNPDKLRHLVTRARRQS